MGSPESLSNRLEADDEAAKEHIASLRERLEEVVHETDFMGKIEIDCEGEYELTTVVRIQSDESPVTVLVLKPGSSIDQFIEKARAIMSGNTEE